MVNASKGVHGVRQVGVGIGQQNGAYPPGGGQSGDDLSFDHGSGLPLFSDQNGVMSGGDGVLPLFEQAQIAGDCGLLLMADPNFGHAEGGGGREAGRLEGGDGERVDNGGESGGPAALLYKKLEAGATLDADARMQDADGKEQHVSRDEGKSEVGTKETAKDGFTNNVQQETNDVDGDEQMRESETGGGAGR